MGIFIPCIRFEQQDDEGGQGKCFVRRRSRLLNVVGDEMLTPLRYTAKIFAALFPFWGEGSDWVAPCAAGCPEVLLLYTMQGGKIKL